MEIRADSVRAKTVFDNAIAALRRKEYPFDSMVLPGESVTLPTQLETGTCEHSRFLFLSCFYMRGGIKSDHAFSALSRMYDSHSEFFSMSFFEEDEKSRCEKLQRTLIEYSLGYHASWVAPSWIHNLKKLRRFWGDDPAILFHGVDSYDYVCGRLIYGKSGMRDEADSNGFCGFREKMVSMLMYFLMVAGLTERFTFPVPVDVQVLRILLEHQLLVAYDEEGRVITEGVLNPEKLRPLGRDLTFNYCVANGISPLELSDALWWLGRTACPNNPGNWTVQVGERNGRKTKILPAGITWSPSQILSFERSCMRCPIQDTCVLNVPGRINSVSGNMELWGKRPARSPQGQLF